MCIPSAAPEPLAASLRPIGLPRSRGFTLIELIVAMVVIGVGVAGILSAFNVSVRGSADPVINKQMLAIAEALLEEVEKASFTYCDPADANAATATSSAGCASVPETLGPETGNARPYDNVNDYNGLTLNPLSDVAGVAVPDLAGYSATIAVAPVALSTITAASGDALRITVNVTAPGGQTFALDGYRTRYAPNATP